jgi:hypothetical protein
MVVDKDDRVVATSAAAATLPGSADGSSPRLLITSLLVAPGDYTLRLAAVDRANRAGSVHHVFSARLIPLDEEVAASDLVLAAAPATPGDALRPSPSATIDREDGVALIEIAGREPSLLDHATIAVEIAAADGAVPLVRAETRAQARDGGKARAFSASLKLGLLPPGDYVAHAVVSRPGRPEARVTRAFRYVGPKAAAAVHREPSVDETALPPPLPRVLVPAPRFAADSVLKPDIVRAHLTALAEQHPASAAIQPIVELARNGRFLSPPSDVRTPPQDEVTLAFIRGLAALEKGELPQATAWFQATLRSASDFLGAAFYLGACHAANGRDRDAAGAWQMSLLGASPHAVYAPLVDALLRSGDGPRALEFIEESPPEAWVDENARLQRASAAYAMVGRYGDALPGLTKLLSATPDDQSLLFLAIQVLYRAHLESPLAGEDRTRFAEYAERYEKLGGSQSALVSVWRAYVLR